MIELITVIIVLVICGLIRLLHLASPAEAPKLYYRNPCSPFIQTLMKACPILTQVYHPPLLWGKSGHVQTLIYVKLGRMKPKSPQGVRHHIEMPDGASMSFDVYEPSKIHSKDKAKFTLVICPGIANSSESMYIRTFVDYAQSHGYRVAVQNHLGALSSEVLSSPRIFTYGGTEEYGAMVDRLLELYPESRLLAVGFSMGGNIITKYLGESPAHADKFLCGMAACQGYEVNDAKPLFLAWAHMRRVYTYAMTLHQRTILKTHHDILFGETAVAKYGRFNEGNIFSATALSMIDENYSCIRAGFANLYDYYKWSSSAYYMQNIKIPMLYLNAEDDPVCPPPLLKYPRQQAENSDNTIFITTKHGGHLGYFEDGYIVPDHFTWLDRILVQYGDAITDLYLHDNMTGSTENPTSTCHDSSGVLGAEASIEALSFSASSGSNFSISSLDAMVSSSYSSSGKCKRSVDAGSCDTESGMMRNSIDNARKGALPTDKIVNQHTSLVQ